MNSDKKRWEHTLRTTYGSFFFADKYYEEALLRPDLCDKDKEFFNAVLNNRKAKRERQLEVSRRPSKEIRAKNANDKLRSIQARELRRQMNKEESL